MPYSNVSCPENFCDIVLPVYNGLSYVKDCVESILCYTIMNSYHLYLVNDFSDKTTTGFLQQLSQVHPHITLHNNSENIGYVQSCNMGITLGRAPYVILINSDVIVTPNWLARLLECALSDTKIASVNPLSNNASQIDLPMVPGANFFAMDEYLQKCAPRHFPDIVTGVGFCILFSRKVLDDVGLFDSIYGRGYCEESDLCMRLTTKGYRTVLADHVYVYHKGNGTFTDSTERYRNNRKIFDSRWSHEYFRQFRAFKKANPLQPLRDLFPLHQRWDPKPIVWQTARGLLSSLRNKNFSGFILTGARGLFQLVKARRPIATPASVAKITRSNRLKVTYVLQDIIISGGVLSVIQIVNELILLGVEARIVALHEDPLIYDYIKFFSKPIIFRNYQDLIKNFPDSDIAVATLWKTAPWVASLRNENRIKTSVYFIQDYESWFFSDNNQVARSQVKATYKLIANKIVMSDWLQKMLIEDGFTSHKISLGMDLARFYPRDIQTLRPTVLAMARPITPYRGFTSVINALLYVKQSFPNVEIILFGDRFLSSYNIPFSYRDEEVISDQERLAYLYSEADVFLDGSDFQGFGRCALEAMACGTACVLTGVGGVTEYARNEKNAIVVPPKRPDLLADATLKILNNSQLKHGLVREGFDTVKNYCHKKEAKKTLAYFKKLMKN